MNPFTEKASPKIPCWLSEKAQKYREKRMLDSLQRTFIRINSHGGFIQAGKLLPKSRSKAFRLALANRQIWFIHLSRSVSTGSHKRFANIFRPEFEGKAFYCSSRTAVVRLLSRAIRPITDRGMQCSVTSFLNGVCSEAEKVAILWNRGYPFSLKTKHQLRNFMQKQSISLDGFYEGKRGLKHEGLFAERSSEAQKP